MVLGGDLPVLPRFPYHGLCASLTHWVGREELSETPCRETVRGQACGQQVPKAQVLVTAYSCHIFAIPRILVGSVYY